MTPQRQGSRRTPGAHRTHARPEVRPDERPDSLPPEQWLNAARGAMTNCPRCSRLPEHQQRAQLDGILDDIARTQARTLEPLPEHVWPDGRALLP